MTMSSDESDNDHHHHRNKHNDEYHNRNQSQEYNEENYNHDIDTDQGINPHHGQDDEEDAHPSSSNINSRRRNASKPSSRRSRHRSSRHRRHHHHASDKNNSFRPVAWYNHSAARLMTVCVFFSFIAYEAFILRAPLNISNHLLPSSTRNLSSDSTIRVPSSIAPRLGDTTDEGASFTSFSTGSTTKKLQNPPSGNDEGVNGGKERERENKSNDNDMEKKDLTEIPADSDVDIGKSPKFRPLRQRHRIYQPDSSSTSDKEVTNIVKPASALQLDVGSSSNNIRSVFAQAIPSAMPPMGMAEHSERSSSSSSSDDQPFSPSSSSSSSSSSSTASAPETEADSSTSTKSTRSNENNEDNSPTSPSKENKLSKIKTETNISSPTNTESNTKTEISLKENASETISNDNNGTSTGAEPGAGENFWQWFQQSKDGGKDNSTSAINCPDADTKRLCTMFYKYLRKYKVRSIYDVSCAKNAIWMPTVLTKAGNELWGLKYYCSVPNSEREHETREALKDISFTEYVTDAWWKTGFQRSQNQAELLFAWDVLPHAAYGRVWNFFVKAKAAGIKYILIDNYPQIQNDPSPKRQYLNVRRHPFRFPPAKEVVQNVTEPGDTEKRQLLFYEVDSLPTNIQ